MKVLLDTHIWLWYLKGSSSLSSNMVELLESPSTEPWISPISVWETAVLADRGKINISSDITSFVENAFEKYPVKEARLSNAIALRSCTLKFAHKDPADRFIAATAMVYKIPLATVDKRLIELEWLETIC